MFGSPKMGVAATRTWVHIADFVSLGSSYNDDMTTITTDQLIQSTNRRSFRQAVGGFLAGAVLASGAFLGVSAVTDSGSHSPAQAPSRTTSSTPVSAQEPGCRIVHGAC